MIHLDTSMVKNIVQMGVTVPNVWLIRHDELPFTVNEARTWHHMKLAKRVKAWREAGYWASKQAKVPKMRSAEIHCIPLLKRLNRDPGAEFLAYKGFLDGAITDAGVMPDDRPPYIRNVTFHAPIKESVNGLAMLVVRCE